MPQQAPPPGFVRPTGARATTSPPPGFVRRQPFKPRPFEEIMGEVAGQNEVGLGDSLMQSAGEWGDVAAGLPTKLRASLAAGVSSMMAREFAELERGSAAVAALPADSWRRKLTGLEGTPEEMAEIRGRTAQELATFRAAGEDMAPTPGATIAQRGLEIATTSAGQSAPAVVTGILTRNPYLAASTMYPTTSAQSFASLANTYGDQALEAGAPQTEEQRLAGYERAGHHARVQGGIEVLTEILPFGKLLKAGTPTVKRLAEVMLTELPGETIATVTQSIDDVLARSPEGATLEEVVEGLVEGGKQVPETWVATIFGSAAQTAPVALGDSIAGRQPRPQPAEAPSLEQQLGALAELPDVPALPAPPPLEVTPEGVVRRPQTGAEARAEEERLAEELGLGDDIVRNLARLEERKQRALAEQPPPAALPAPDETIYVDPEGRAGGVRATEARRRAIEDLAAKRISESEAMGLTPDILANLERLQARQASAAQPAPLALPAPDPTIYVDPSGWAGTVGQHETRMRAGNEEARAAAAEAEAMGLTPDVAAAAVQAEIGRGAVPRETPPVRPDARGLGDMIATAADDDQGEGPPPGAGAVPVLKDVPAAPPADNPFMRELGRKIAERARGAAPPPPPGFERTAAPAAERIASAPSQEGAGPATGAAVLDPVTREKLAGMKLETGWAETGGRMIRKGSGTDPFAHLRGVEHGEVTGRTKWVPRAEWYRNRPHGLPEKTVHEVIEAALAGKPLKGRKKDMLDYLLETIRTEGQGEERRAGEQRQGERRAPPPRDTPERRTPGRGRRKSVGEMTLEEARAELLTHALTGIPNRRAYDERERLAHQVAIDVDSLKWVNDNMGHESGNELLRAVGQALKESGGAVYHFSGDEFALEAATPEQAAELIESIEERLAQATIEITKADGTVITVEGVGVSYGQGATLDEADADLSSQKSSREATGLRAARGEKPPGATVGSRRGEGRQDLEDRAPTPPAEQLTVEYAGQRFPVSSLEDAQAKWDDVRETSGAGASGMSTPVKIFRGSKQIGTISYNGRLWGMDEKPLRELPPPDDDIDRVGEGDDGYRDERSDYLGFKRAREAVEEAGVAWKDIEILKTPDDYRRAVRKYGLPNFIAETTRNMPFGRGGSLFVDDDTGKPVAYAPSSAHPHRERDEVREGKRPKKPTQGDLFTMADARPGTNEKQIKLANEILSERRADVGHGVRTLYSQISEDFREDNVTSLLGKKLKSGKDLAALAEVYRDPRFETLRYLFVNADGKVVAETGVGARLPGSSAAYPAEEVTSMAVRTNTRDGIAWLKRIMARSKATGLWLLHNHPSGASDPSQSDRRLTVSIAQGLGIQVEHVVIDHNEYSYLEASKSTDDGEYRSTVQVVRRPLSDKLTPDPLRKAGKQHAVMGEQIGDPLDVAKIGKSFQKSGWLTVIGATTRHVTNTIGEIPLAALDNGRTFRAALARFAIQNGSGALFIASVPVGLEQSAMDVLDSAHAGGYIRDAVDTRGTSLVATRGHGIFGSSFEFGREVGPSTRKEYERYADTDLLGDDTKAAQATADETRKRDSRRSPNRDADADTGAPGDLFTRRRQRDIDDIKEPSDEQLGAEREGLVAFQRYVREQSGLGELTLRALPNGDVRLETMAAKETGRGAGTRAMGMLTDYADRHGIRLVLGLAERGHQPIEGGPKTTSRTRLREFYKRFDFVQNKGRHKDFTLSMYDTMYRDPQQRVREEEPEFADLEMYLGVHGVPIESRADAERRFGTDRIFAFHEMGAEPTEVTSIEMLRNYTPSQLMALPAGERDEEGYLIEGKRDDEGGEDITMRGPLSTSTRRSVEHVELGEDDVDQLLSGDVSLDEVREKGESYTAAMVRQARKEADELEAAGDTAKAARYRKMADKLERVHRAVYRTDLTKQDVIDWSKWVRDRHGARMFHVYLTNAGDLSLSSIAIEKAQQGQGRGSALMKELTDYADQHGKRVVLQLATGEDKTFGTTSRGRLVKFYKRFGFVENKGRNKDFTLSPGMYRKPATRDEIREGGEIREGDDAQTDTPAFKRWFGDSKVVDDDGAPLRVYHGTGRADRFQGGLKKERATSGPMPYFTADPAIASNYAKGKSDTSVDDESYQDWFAFLKDGKEQPIAALWRDMTLEQRTAFNRAMPKIRKDEDAGTIIVDPDGRGMAVEGTYEQYLRENRGNGITAAIDLWLSSAALFDEEHRFMDVLRAAGVDTTKVEYKDLQAGAPGVLPVYLRIEKPLTTNKIPQRVVRALKRAADEAPAPKQHGADPWDKVTRDPAHWISELVEGMKDGGNTGFVWTSIPDFVTDTLIELGYDGIHDVGGKMGGEQHDVWLPFEPKQVKSAVGNRGTFDPESDDIVGETKERRYGTARRAVARGGRRSSDKAPRIPKGDKGYAKMAQSALDVWNDKAGWRWGPLGKMPAQRAYLQQRYEALGRIGRSQSVARQAYNAFKNATAAEAKEIYDYLITRDASPASISNKALRGPARHVKETIDAVGQRLVAEGMLSQQAYDEHAGEYLPRVYLKHLLGDRAVRAIGAGKATSDMGYLKQRLSEEQLPKEVRDVILGEITDPAFLTSFSLGRTLRDLALVDFFKNIAGNKQWVPEHATVEWNGREVSPFWLDHEAKQLRRRAALYAPATAKKARDVADNMERTAATALEQLGAQDLTDYRQMPDSNRYGVLRGLWLRKEIYNDLVGQRAAPAGDSAAERVLGDGGVLSGLTRAFKISKVVLNPPTQVRNFVSNLMLLQLSGVPARLVPVRIGQALRSIATKDRYYEIYEKFGGTAATWQANEVREITQEWIRLKELDKNPLTRMLAFGAALVNRASNVYGTIEALGKIAKVIDAMKREGKSASDAMLEAHEALFDYSLVHPNVRYLRNNPLGAPFITFQYKALPQLAKTLAKHPLRYAPYALIPALLLAKLMDDYDVEEEDVEKLRNALPAWMRERGQMLLLPWKDSKGRWQLIDMGYLVPWGLAADLYATAKESPGKAARNAVQQIALGGPLVDVSAAIETNVDPFTGRQIANPADSPADQIRAIMWYAWNTAAPGFLTQRGAVQQTIKAATGTNVNARGEPGQTVGQALMRAFGVNVYPADPVATRAANLRSLNYEIEEMQQRGDELLANRNLTAAERDEIRESFRRRLREANERARKYAAESEIHPNLRTSE